MNNEIFNLNEIKIQQYFLKNAFVYVDKTAITLLRPEASFTDRIWL